MIQNNNVTQIHIAARILHSDDEYTRMQTIRVAGFTPWYVTMLSSNAFNNSRVTMNAVAQVFPEFFQQARTNENLAIGYLASIPGYWNGDASTLSDLQHYRENFRLTPPKIIELGVAWRCVQALPALKIVFNWRKKIIRKHLLEGKNTVVLVAMTIDPKFQGMQIPRLFLDAIKNAAHNLGMMYVIAPFRPVKYGQFKAEAKEVHSTELFHKYCLMQDEHGLPFDPWFRSVVRNGVKFLRPEPNSFRVERSIEEFERLRNNFKPECWYSPKQDVWECGETPTWYVDRNNGKVTSVEPNLWGQLPIEV